MFDLNLIKDDVLYEHFEIAAILEVTPPDIEALVKDKKIAARCIGKKILISPKNLKRFLTIGVNQEKKAEIK